MLGALAAVGAVLSLEMFLRFGRDDARRAYWLGYAVLAALVFAVWIVLRYVAIPSREQFRVMGVDNHG
jgi:uncharacterized PurR-regulated membrane protein YhhQ (DUF165 family)